MEAVLGPSTGPERSGTRATPSADPVLVVDDDPVAVELICRFLAKLRLANPVVGLSTGDRAVAHLTGVLSGTTIGALPALVLLDHTMPGRSGLEVLRWIKGQPGLATVPVVMLTGASEVDDINEAYDLGVASYLVKPVGFEALGDVLRSLEAPWTIRRP